MRTDLIATLNIRDAIEVDLPAIVEIYNAAVPSRMATADLVPVSVESRLAWFHEHTPSKSPLWVVELDETVVGWLSFQMFYGRLAYSATAEISVYVSPDHQRRGIGQQLLKQAIHRSPTLGLTTLLALIFGHNQPSLQLFGKFGFQRWGCLPQVAELDGVQRDLVIIGRKCDQETI